MNRTSWILLIVFVPITVILFYFAFLNKETPIDQRVPSVSAFCEESCKQEAYGIIAQRLFSYYPAFDALSSVEKETLLNDGIEVS